MTDETLSRRKEVPERDAKTYSGDDLVAVFGVDSILDGLGRRLAEVLRLDLDQVLYCALRVW